MKTERRFEPTRTSVPAVRSFVHAVATRLPEGVVERVMLVVSELATNALLHAGTDFLVSVEIGPSLLRIEMTDRGGGMPEVQPPQPPTSLHGRGLQIVDHLADRWGIAPVGAGSDTLIWVEVDLDGPESPARAPGSSIDCLG